MRRAILAALTAAGLAGCATTGQNQPPAYGNFAPMLPAALSSRIVDDSVRQLAALYPPAQSRFTLRQPTPDPYGAGLVAALREKGYAVREDAESPKADATAAPPAPAEPAPAGLDLRYLLDQPGAGDLVRLVLTIGDKTLARAYVASAETVAPAGAWVRKE